MKTPFNFENQSEDGDESDYLKGKNAFSNSEFAQEAANHPDKKIMALFEAAQNSLEEAEGFAEDDPTTGLRQQIMNMITDQPIVQKEVSAIDYKQFRELEIYIGIITDRESVFHVEPEYDRPDEIEDPEGLDPPYEDIRLLYDDMRRAFERSFNNDLDPLDIIPRRIFMSRNGLIHSVKFDLLVNRFDMSTRFQDVFQKSHIFQLNYDRYLKERPYNRFTVSGIITSPHDDEDEVEDTIQLDHRV